MKERSESAREPAHTERTGEQSAREGGRVRVRGAREVSAAVRAQVAFCYSPAYVCVTKKKLRV